MPSSGRPAPSATPRTTDTFIRQTTSRWARATASYGQLARRIVSPVAARPAPSRAPAAPGGPGPAGAAGPPLPGRVAAALQGVEGKLTTRCPAPGSGAARERTVDERPAELEALRIEHVARVSGCFPGSRFDRAGEDAGERLVAAVGHGHGDLDRAAPVQ